MFQRLMVRNHRGEPVPRTLGLLLGGAGVVSTLLVLGVDRGLHPAGIATAVGACLVLAAGIVDDVVGEGPRGLRGHLRALQRGRVTTGILKAMVLVACSIVVVSQVDGRALVDRLLGVILIAACGNLWNGLDVRPGRAFKAFLPIGVIGMLVGPVWIQPGLPGIALASVPLLIRDLRERAMLGDGGSNLLGYCAGVALYAALPSWALVLATAAVVAGNLAAETVSLSTLIDRSSLLRAIDRAGTLPD